MRMPMPQQWKTAQRKSHVDARRGASASTVERARYVARQYRQELLSEQDLKRVQHKERRAMPSRAAGIEERKDKR